MGRGEKGRGEITGGKGLREKGAGSGMRQEQMGQLALPVSPGTMIHWRAPHYCSVPLDFRVLAMDSSDWTEDAWGG